MGVWLHRPTPLYPVGHNICCLSLEKSGEPYFSGVIIGSLCLYDNEALLLCSFSSDLCRVVNWCHNNNAFTLLNIKVINKYKHIINPLLE